MNGQYELVITFLTDLDMKHNLRITGADPFVTASDIKAAIAEIISSNVLITANGIPASGIAAKLIKREREDIDVS